jgi:tRNA threonylcarbamoyl adenosine modification protein YeaZ
MLILALDTALAACSAALYDTEHDKVLASRAEPMQRGHAERLAGMVDEIMREAQQPFSAIDRIAVTTGPGTFTGVRVALAFARALAVAIKRPVTGITTLAALAATAQTKHAGTPIAAIIDARRGEVYFQMFAPDLTPLTPPATLPVEQFGPQFPAHSGIAIGSGTELIVEQCPQLLPSGLSPLPCPEALARLAATRDVTDAPPAPLYLRAPDAKAQQPLVALAPADVCITKAGAEAAALLAELHTRCFTKPWPEPEMAQVVAMPGTTALIARDQEHSKSDSARPLGFVIFRQVADEAEIITIATAPNARRRGIAKSLLDAAMTGLKQSGCRDLHLEVDETNSAALGFYNHSGFVQTGRREAYYAHPDGTRSDAITMRRTL